MDIYMLNEKIIILIIKIDIFDILVVYFRI